MAAKPDSAPAPEAAVAAAAEPAPAKGGKLGAMLPVILVLVLSPVITWAVVQFALLPQLDKRLASLPPVAAAPAGEHVPGGGAETNEAAAPAAEHGGKGEKEGEKKGGVPNNYEFSNVVVNLAGTMGTRYLKTTFLVTGKSNELKGLFDANKPRLLDVTLNVLSSLTLADLEEAGAKNLIRERLVASYNQALGKRIAEQVYFSDFVVQ